MSRDESDVQWLAGIPGMSMANPIDVSEEYHGHFINLVTGMILPDDDTDKLIAVQKAGEQNVKWLCWRAASKMHNSRNSQTTASNMWSTLKDNHCQWWREKATMKASENLFQYLISMAQKKGLK